MTAIVFACVLCCYCGAASAQTFSVDLHELTAIYDELFPERTAVAVWDTLAPYDFDNVLIGNQHHKVPSFLKTNVLRTRTIEDWAVVPGYRVRFTIPLTASWERQQRTVGALTLPVPRDLDIAGLEIEFTPIENVVTEIRRQSLEDAWRETVRLFISTQEITGSLSRQGITINIPVPMPRQLESIFGPSDKTSEHSAQSMAW
ncbi:MAG: hypothetical protein IH969_09155, partial [Candidatus Krumholzibacteriota bacterium]|nr:hypothetical protein [Candidatus Krumholzibacteriota bacterium]